MKKRVLKWTMKRKLLTLFLAACIAFSLCACGGQSASSAAPPTPNNPDSKPSQSQTTDESPDEDYPTQDTQPESEQPEQDNISPKGLIFYEKTNPGGAGNPTYITVHCLDLDSGETDAVANFTYSAGADLGGYHYETATHGLLSLFIYGSGRYSFSDDYSKLAIDIVFFGSNEVHAGWIDTDGVFFDVTKALGLQSKSDFDAPVKYYSAGFAEGYFLYYDKENDTLCYVPVDEVEPSAVQTGWPANFDKIPSSNHFGPSSVTSWADDTYCFLDYTYFRNGVGDWTYSVIYNTETQEIGKYVPGDSRISWGGVISPDRTEVAFMSSPYSSGWGGDGVTSDIYIIPVGGDEPVKVTNCPLQLGLYLGGPCQLIDWR